MPSRLKNRSCSSEWSRLRDIIKHKLNQNIAMFLAEQNDNTATPPTPWTARVSTPGGMKLPPFPARERNEQNPNEAPKSKLTEEEANDAKKYIFAQLHEFEGAPPFTIQRVCELCIRPKQHYKRIGKYLRAFEKSLLVTSTWDAFPVPPESDTNKDSTKAPAEPSFFPSRDSSVPSTPLFSPIPFLHDDARRSKSRSPPPFVLDAVEDKTGEPPLPAQNENHGLEPRALGLVDELDDPAPGHMSDHPTALTTTTTVGLESGAKPLFATLEERFVKSEIEAPQPSTDPTQQTGQSSEDQDAMDLDADNEDKENKA
ncbi:hypothetical protein PUNSTDRAFT_71551 [Punctularia strigosozonata HHB-11173 SS5]|uniref:uncharacterized protein n=1 Tax=Punctularia strigosozonata (strain HHB-11173) TaxID=741275 RepID=UPI000441734D|nr:uncharacterized protein PUNSTDRAFT_71551 [Punctularia strigosozonata HHB-11173 SS5]EIN07432.1 hypothetical protein PUNSTDRAFT_71551 [Punctularia strigosozonata HHB-11173 SS5]